MRILPTLVAAGLLLASAPAQAGDADDRLAKVDLAIANFEDSKILFDVVNQKPGMDKPQGMSFRSVVSQGKTLTSFESPGDVKGTRVLTMSATQMWIWLPDFGKIRKVASHNLNQGFMGTTLSQQDMGTTGWGMDYEASLVSETETEATLDLQAKDPKKVGYPHLKLTYEKARNLPLKVEYLAEDGSVLRTQTRADYQCPNEEYCMFGKMKMVDHTRGDAWTMLVVKELEINTDVDQGIFTPRTLQLGL